MSLRLDWCSADAARYAVERWHYSRTMPVNKTVRIGVWESCRFVGCVVFSCGSSGVGLIGKGLGYRTTEVCELARVALTQHAAPVTRIVSVAVRMLRKAQPGLRLIVSYADPGQGHIGGIYQGGNWVYVGRSAADSVYIDRDGREWHSRSINRGSVQTGLKVHCGKARPCPRAADMVGKRELERKYKYFMPLDEETRKRIVPLAKPYPKRTAGEQNGPCRKP